MQGQMTYRLAFDAPAVADNGAGGRRRGWTEGLHECWAAVRFLRGGETVIAARLAGVQPVVVTIRACDAARAIRHDWRIRDLRSGTVYSISAPPVASDSRGFLDIVAQSGVAP